MNGTSGGFRFWSIDAQPWARAHIHSELARRGRPSPRAIVTRARQSFVPRCRFISSMDRNFLTPGENVRGRVERPKARNAAMARKSAGSPAPRQTGWFSSSTLRNFFTGIYRSSSSVKPNRSLSTRAPTRSLSRSVSFFMSYSMRGVTTDTVMSPKTAQLAEWHLTATRRRDLIGVGKFSRVPYRGLGFANRHSSKSRRTRCRP